MVHGDIGQFGVPGGGGSGGMGGPGVPEQSTESPPQKLLHANSLGESLKIGALTVTVAAVFPPVEGTALAVELPAAIRSPLGGGTVEALEIATVRPSLEGTACEDVNLSITTRVVAILGSAQAHRRRLGSRRDSGYTLSLGACTVGPIRAQPKLR